MYPWAVSYPVVVCWLTLALEQNTTSTRTAVAPSCIGINVVVLVDVDLVGELSVILISTEEVEGHNLSVLLRDD